MNATPKISLSVEDCKHIKITDVTVNTEQEYYGRAFFMTADNSTVVKANFSSMNSPVAMLDIIRDGRHNVYMACVDTWEAGLYPAGSIVLAPVIAGVEPPETKIFGNPLRYWRANKQTSSAIENDPLDWDMLAEDETSIDYFLAAGNVKIASEIEIVDCKILKGIRKSCNVFEITKNDDVEYDLHIYSIKSYLAGQLLLTVPASWVENKMELDFATLFPGEPTNIYIIKMVDPDTQEFYYTVVYNLCQIHECMQLLIRDVLCRECKDCTPTKEENFKRTVLNKMNAIYMSLMMNIHASEFDYIGADNIDESRYTLLRQASEKLDNMLLLIDQCGECTEIFENCSSC